MSNLMMTEQEIITAFLNRMEAMVRMNSDTRPRLQLRVPVPLDVAATVSNPLKIGGVFTGFYVESATDTLTTVNVSTTSPETANLTNYTTLRLNDASTFEQPVKDVYLTWAAQPGKTMTLIFYTGMNFIPGSKISVTSGGVAISDGASGVTSSGVVNVTTSATLILPADSSRLSATIINTSAVQIAIGGSNVGHPGSTSTNPGLILAPGASVKISNTGAIYGITKSFGSNAYALQVTYIVEK